MLLLDVNIPMYASRRDHPYRQSCAWIMTEIAQKRINAVIDTEAIQELLHRYGAIGQPDFGADLATNVIEIDPAVYSVGRAEVHLAIDLFRRYARQGVQSRDVIHAAVVRSNGMSGIISTDRHFDVIDGIQRLDPHDLFHKA
jgi:predicted nucleic acid-binding protein